MGECAYLVAYLDTTVHPPVVKGCGIYSENAKTLTDGINNKKFCVDIQSVSGRDYEEARKKLVAFLKEWCEIEHSPFRWVKPFIEHELED